MIPIKDLSRFLPRLTPLRLMRLLKEMGKAQQEELSPGEGLFLWLANWLAVTQPVNQDQQDLLLVELGKEIISYGNEFEKNLEESKDKIPVSSVCILDRTFAVVSGRSALLVLEKGTYVKTLPCSPFEVISYNLASFYTMMQTRLAQAKAKASEGVK